MQSTKPLYIAAAVLLAVAAFHYRSGSDVPAEAALPARYDSARDARQDIETGTAQAKAAGKQVLVEVGGDWDGWCGRLDRFLMENPDVQAQLDRSFVAVKVGVEQGVPPPDALSSYPPMPGYPHLFVLDASGGLVESKPAADLESGDYFDRDKFLLFLRSHAPKAISAAPPSVIPSSAAALSVAPSSAAAASVASSSVTAPSVAASSATRPSAAR